MRKIVLLIVGLVLVVGLGGITGCASDGGDGNEPKGVYSDAPAGSKLAQVQMGSTDAVVRKLLGDPDNTNAYMTGKAWIPFYYGPDTHRTDWMYRGQGRVVFSRNRWTGGLKVIRVLYNPNELK